MNQIRFRGVLNLNYSIYYFIGGGKKEDDDGMTFKERKKQRKKPNKQLHFRYKELFK